MAGGIGGSMQECRTPGGYSSTLTERLERQKENLEKNLGEVNKALDILKENPKMQTLLDIVSKVS